ncbi:MAG: N-6 DNA methylase, partial [Dolichospermum sp.]
NVSILFIDKGNKDDVVLIDASSLGETVKDGKNQKTVLTEAEENQIITTFNHKKAIDDFSVVVSYDQIAEKNYSLSAGQYFDVKIEYTDITPEEFEDKIQGFTYNLNSLFSESKNLEKNILEQLQEIYHEYK